MSDKNHEKDNIVDGEVVEEFGGETLLNLPQISPDDTQPGPKQPPAQKESRNDRRHFLTRLAIGGAGALALGGSAALLLNPRKPQERVVILPNGAEVTTEEGDTDVALLVERLSQLEYELALVTSERDQCLSELNSTSTQRDDLQVRLDEAEAMLALWDQHNDVGLDNLLKTALVVVSAALGGVTNIATPLVTGLTNAQSAIDDFTARLPGPSAGIRWLGNQVESLSAGLAVFFDRIEEAIDDTGVTNFVIWLLDRLPFGSGNQAKAALEAMDELVQEIPDLISGINDDILVPLADWFGDEDENNLYGILLTPFTEGVLEPTVRLLDGISELSDTFETEMIAPLEGALEQREEVLQQIEARRSAMAALS